MALNIKALFPVLVHPVDTEEEERIKLDFSGTNNPDQGHKSLPYSPYSRPKLTKDRKKLIFKELNIIK